MPLIGGDKIRSLIKNATKDSSTGSNESLMKTNTRDSNNMIKDSDQLEMDRKNKIIVDNLKKSGWIVNKTQWIIGDLKKSEPKNMWGGINVSQWWNLNNSEIKSRGLNIESGVNNVNDINNVNNNVEWIRINKNNWVLENQKEGRINGWGGWWEVENSENSKKMTNALVDLYKVAGRLNERNEELDIDKLRNSFSEFENIGDDVLGDLVEDMKIMVKDNDMDLLKIAEAYPELGKINVEDLNDVSKAALINNMVESDWDKWGLVDWVLFAPNVVSESLGGKTMTEYLGDFGDWAYDKKKNRYTSEKEDEFFRNLQYEYRDYVNEKGEWLEPGGEKAKEFGKKLEQYTNKAAIGMGIDMVGNFVKWLPRILDTAVNIVNRPGQFLKSITGMVSGLWQKWIEKVSEKKILWTDFLDNRAKKSGAESWQDLKENVWERAEKEGWVKSKVAAWLMTNEEIWDGMIDYFKENYGSAENLERAIIERPEDVISDTIWIAQGAVWLARSAGIIDAARAEMIIKNLGKLDMYELSTSWVTKWVAKLGKGEINLAKKGLWKSMKGIEKWGELLKKSPLWKMGEFVVNKLTGLSEEERKFIRENWDIVDDYLKGNRSAEEIADLIKTRFDDLLEWKRNVWEFYNFIKNNENALVKTNWIVSGIKWILSDLWIKIGKNWVLKFGELSFTPTQQKQLQGVYNYVKALENMGDSVSAKDVWRARQLIDTMANWEGNSKVWLDAEVMNNIRSMRWKIDDALKEQVAWFKDADSQYRELSNLVKELKKDWFTKEGNLKDNALSKIRNLTNKGNEAKLERLEKQFPGITNSLKGLGVSQSIEKASKMMVGQYAQQLLIWWWLWQLISGDLSIATALIGAWILTPKNLVKILKREGNFMNKWKSIADKLSVGTALNKSNLDRLKRFLVENNEEIVEKVKEEEWGKWWEKIDMDKIDLEYDKAQREAYVGGKSTEKKLTKEERASLLKKYAKWSENNGFVMKIVDDMGEWTHWMADLDRKLVKLEENFGDTTAQHEFFHELFSVIDEDTKKYVINEVKNYLDLTDDVAAEEWLAESFGIYARRKEIKLGNIRLKGNRLQRFQSKLRDLFQRAYEWIQNYSMDRKTINKLFNEVYGAVDGKVLDESWKFNLAEKLGINEKTPKLWVSENWLRYKKGWNLEKNDYITNWLKKMETSVLAPNGKSNGLSEKVSTKPSTNFFELKDWKKNYILVDFADGKGKQKVYWAGGGRNQFTKRRLQLSNKNLDYRKNLDRLNSWLSDGDVGMSKSVLVGRTGKGKSIRLSKQWLYHIYEKHWAIDFDTLIEAINDPTRQKQETVWDKRFRYEIDLGWNDDRVLLLGLNGHTFKKWDLIIEKDANKVQSYSIAGASERESSKVPSKDVRLKRDSTGKELSKGQQEYFKDSKIRDAEGNLLRVYHWTHNDFTVFDRNKIGTNTNNKWIFGEWFYATSKESFANMYAGKWYSKEWLEWKVMEWYVDIKNPFMRNDYKGEVALEKLRKELWLGKNVIKLNRLDNMIHPLIEPKQSEKFRAALEKAGYDGVVFKYPEWWWDEIVAFNSNQFKNIDNLNPTKNPDIRYKKDSAGKELSQAQQDYFKDSKVRDANGKLLRMYHGSKAKFTVFDTKKIWEHWTSKGRWFYFTPNKGMGEWYWDVMEVYLDIKKPLNYEGRDISKAQLKELINRIYNEQMTKEWSEWIGILDDFGDISYEWKDKVLREAVDIIDSNTNDVDLMNELIWISWDYDTVAKVITDYLWYDWVIKDEEYVIFNSNQAKNINNLNPTKNPDIRFKKWLNKKLGRVWVMNSKGNIGWLSRKGLWTMAKWLRYKQQQDLKN